MFVIESEDRNGREREMSEESRRSKRGPRESPTGDHVKRRPRVRSTKRLRDGKDDAWTSRLRVKSTKR